MIELAWKGVMTNINSVVDMLRYSISSGLRRHSLSSHRDSGTVDLGIVSLCYFCVIGFLEAPSRPFTERYR